MFTLQGPVRQDGIYHCAHRGALVINGRQTVYITGYFANLTRSFWLIHGQGETKTYLWQPVVTSPIIWQAQMEEPQKAVSPGAHQYSILLVDAGWLAASNPPQVKQKQLEADSQSMTERST